MSARITGLLAEDEPLLAQSLQRMLAQSWPQLEIVAVAADGVSASTLALQHLPDILFLDIRMPGKDGLQVAEEVLDEWPNAWSGTGMGPGTAARPVPLVVFVTAYEEFALAAFERQAADYILKPATPERLAKTVANLQRRLDERRTMPGMQDLAALLTQVQALRDPPTASIPSAVAGTAPATSTGTAIDMPFDGTSNGPARIPSDRPLDILHLGMGNTVRMVPLADVVYCEAGEKYLNVVSTRGEGLIRMSLRELLARAAPGMLMQVHRSIAVNPKRVLSATRDDAGHLSLCLQDSTRSIPVSRAFAHQFRAM
jgi:DNA-binding LytR/AlgR family response regulator